MKNFIVEEDANIIWKTGSRTKMLRKKHGGVGKGVRACLVVEGVRNDAWENIKRRESANRELCSYMEKAREERDTRWGL